MSAATDHALRASRPTEGASATTRILRLLPWAATVLVMIAAPYILTSGTARTMMSLMGIMVVFSLSYNMLLGQTGMLSFGHAVYYGLGAFFAVHAMNVIIREHLPVPLPLIPLVGGVAGLGFGIVFGAVSTRRGGTAFAMISLGLAELVSSSANVLRSFFGGEEGITTNRTKLLRVFDLGFGPQIQVYYLIAVWCFLSMVAIYAISRTPLGRMCNAVRENPERVQYVGYDPHVIRYVAFCLSAFFAGIAGSLAAINFEIVNSSYVGLGQSGTVLLAAFIGGIGFFVGPIIGAIVVTYLQVMLSDLTEVWQLYFGLLFIAIVLFAPGGIAGLIIMHGPALRARTIGRLVPAYLGAAIPGTVMLTGTIMLIEMAVVALKPNESGATTLMGYPVDVATGLPWALALALTVGGLVVFRLMAPRAAAAFGDATGSAPRRDVAA